MSSPARIPIFKLIPLDSIILVMPGLVPGIHVFFSYCGKTWMASELGLPEFRTIEVLQVG